MSITISEQELLDMPVELLSDLQTYLRGHRAKTLDGLQQIENKKNFIQSNIWKVPEAKLVLSEVGDANQSHIGVLVEQDDRAYIARKWCLTEEVKKIIQLALDSGFDRLWRYRHPQDEYFIGGIKEMIGAPHIGFSRNHHERWLFVLGQEARPPKLKVITFHKKYDRQLTEVCGLEEVGDENSISKGQWARETRGGKNLFPHPADLQHILKSLDFMAINPELIRSIF